MARLAGANGQREEFHVVGKPNLPGTLSYNLATGKAKFGTDVVVPGVLHAKFLRSPYANAVLKSVDIGPSLANTHLVICAIQNAIGKRVDPPATPDKVLKALGKA
jgi:CO/xanthine dehydrogenase Mo-binding subunit